MTSQKYLPTAKEKQKYLDYLKKTGVAKTPQTIAEDVRIDFIATTIESVNTRWPDQYDQEELKLLLGDKLIFEPAHYLVSEEPKIFTPHFLKSLEKATDPEDYYGHIFLELKANTTFQNKFKALAYSNYVQLCLELNIPANLQTLNIFS
jgi:hypothetical protein